MGNTVKAVVFDIDGTLVMLPIDWNAIVSEISRISNGGAKTFLGFVARYYNTKEFWHIHKLLEEEELRAAESMRILDGAPNYIEGLCGVMRIGFVTMQSRKAARRILEKLGLTKCVDALVAREDAPTRATQLSVVLSSLGVERKDVVFVGDKVGDAIAAIVNNISAVIVLRNPVSMRISETDYLDEDLEVFGIPIVRSFSEAVEVVKKLINS
ncbi:MAG: HAD-IA family hydrolase [Ignisphaera sp.]|nr:HAD-IA family hydrolase [Ignisphaera sp.]MCX8168555.1 HAD-IA family hydrolase [Ignisphaera sp.]MDW8085141.1 HAD-IA family hydrolase [Ignisphaera sp.]